MGFVALFAVNTCKRAFLDIEDENEKKGLIKLICDHLASKTD